ncbi:hypothetical protein T09_14568 [Trichinella sp. T9]|nr:hypothetical protein T09_14568 [Trichinella sp. T9]
MSWYLARLPKNIRHDYARGGWRTWATSFRKKGSLGPKQNLCLVGVAGTDLRVRVAAVRGVGVVLPQFRQRLCECRCPVTQAVGKRGRFIVDVDASGDGLGAVLGQREGKAERVVAYSSRALTKAERRYCATRREMLGLESEGQVARWLESEAELDFEVEHRAGRLHGNADALSRNSFTQCGRLSFKDQFLAAQKADPEIQLLRQWLVGTCWPVECPAECSRDLHMLWQQRRIWVDEDSLIWRHGRDLSAVKVSMQALVPGAL